MAPSLSPTAATSSEARSQQLAFVFSERERLQALLTRLASIEPSAYERAGEQPIRELRKLLQQVLVETERQASHLMEWCDANSGSRADDQGVDATPFESDFTRLSDLCFMVIADSRAKQRDLIRSSFETDSLRVLSACASSLRRLRKALSSIDTQLSRLLGLGATSQGLSMLANSLEIRKAYGILRQTAEASRPPDPSQVRARLRALHLRIQLLSDKDLYPQLRLDDRLQLARLYERLCSCIASAADPIFDLRLWQDAVGFMQLLSQVNLRQELREHDAAVVSASLTELQASTEQTVSPTFLNALRPLLGLHDALDELLRFDQRERAAYLTVLSALDAGLRQQPAQRSSAEM